MQASGGETRFVPSGEQLGDFLGVRLQVHSRILGAGTAAVGCEEEFCSDAVPEGAHITESVCTHVPGSFME